MIVSMRKMTLVAPERDREKLMDTLAWCGCCEILNTVLFDRTKEAPEALAKRSAGLADRLARLSSVLRFAEEERQEFEKIHPKTARDKPLFSVRKQKTFAEFSRIAETESEVIAAVESLETLSGRRARLASEIAQKRAAATQLSPFAVFPEKLSSLGGTQASEFFLGTLFLREEQLAELETALSNCATKVFGDCSEGLFGQTVVLFCAAPRTESEQVRKILSDLHFSPCPFDFDSKPGEKLAALRAEIAADERELETLAETASMAEVGPIEDFFDYLSAMRERTEQSGNFRYTDTCFVLNAWVPENAEEVLEEAVRETTDAFDMTFSLPEEGDAPPTFAKNKRFIAPFESVTNMYSVPSPYERDPNLFVMIFFLIFFGIMLSDAGYGILLAAGAFILLRFVKLENSTKKMIFVLGLGGVSTIVWGTLFGGWFGINLSPDSPSAIIRFLNSLKWFSPLEEPILMLGLCMGLGVVQILCGMGLRFAAMVREGKLWDALLDVGSWYLFFLGLGLFAVSALVGSKGLRLWGLEGMGAALCVLILTQGRHEKGLLKKFGKGLASLYGLVGYLSDVLSYARLFGLGLATGVIALVMNTLAVMLFHNPWTALFGVVIAAGGHIFNLAINVLGSYVHDCRLQYIEFFTRFYEGGGRVFRPMLSNLKYNVIK